MTKTHWCHRLNTPTRLNISFRVSGAALSWLNSYIYNQSQYVRSTSKNHYHWRTVLMCVMHKLHEKMRDNIGPDPTRGWTRLSTPPDHTPAGIKGMDKERVT